MSRVVGLILAAGMSTRLGRSKHLIQLGQHTVIEHVVDRALASDLDEMLVVTGHEAEAVRKALTGRDVQFVHNPDYAEGQGTSLAGGVRALPDDVDAVLILLGDQPLIDVFAVNAVVQARVDGASIAQSAYQDGRGHPVLFGREWFRELAELRGDVGGRAILRAHPEAVRLVPFDADLPGDLDTDEDVLRLQPHYHSMNGMQSACDSTLDSRERGHPMDFKDQIKEHMPVICSNGGEFATVDHLDGDTIKLTKDDEGNHHWIPLQWVVRVDEHVHIDRSGEQAKQEWSDSSPQELHEK